MPSASTCAFCRIIRGEQPADVVLDSAEVLAILDHRPLFPGHVLLLPKAHIQTLDELPARLIEPLFATAQRLAIAVEAAMEAQGTFVALNNRVSQSVPHLHVHVVPRTKGDGLKGFFWPRHAYRDDAHRKDTALRIRDRLSDRLRLE